jgi:hypothetical protein
MPTEPEKSYIKEDDYVLLNTKKLDFIQYISRPNKALSTKFIGLFQVIQAVNLLSLNFVSLTTFNFTKSSTPPNFIPANHLPELSLSSPTLSPNLLPHQSKPLLAKGLTSVPIPSAIERPQESTLGF